MIYPADHLKTTLFLDIETVPQFKEYDELSDLFKKHWKRKAHHLDRNVMSDDESALSLMYANKAGIFAEYAKIICISVGFITNEKLRIKSFYGHDEAILLADFADLINAHYPIPQGYYLCGHNIKEFDIPFLCRRMLINEISFPQLFLISGKKPWQTEHLVDTMELWKFGDIKNFTSLELLATCLNIETPKDDIDGSQVAHVYWEDNDLERIVHYCQKDVITVAQIMQKFAGQPLISNDNIEIVK